MAEDETDNDDRPLSPGERLRWREQSAWLSKQKRKRLDDLVEADEHVSWLWKILRNLAIGLMALAAAVAGLYASFGGKNR